MQNFKRLGEAVSSGVLIGLKKVPHIMIQRSLYVSTYLKKSTFPQGVSNFFPGNNWDYLVQIKSPSCNQWSIEMWIRYERMHPFFPKNLAYKNLSLVFKPKFKNKLKTSPSSVLGKKTLKFSGF